MCSSGAVQLLKVCLQERISAAAEDFLLLVEKGKETTEIPQLRALLTDRLTGAVQDIVELFEKTVAEYVEEYEDKVHQSELEIRRQRKLLDVVKLHRAVLPPDVQRLLVSKEALPSKQQGSNPSLDQGPLLIKEEPEELWSSQEGEQLQGPEEAPVTEVPFTLYTVPVKAEDDEVDTEDSDDYGEGTSQPQSGLESQKNNVPKSHKRSDTGDKLFSCSDCAKSFNHKAALTAHMRIHTGEKPYSCPYCAKGFGYKVNLDTHMRVHTGEKPFSCTDCSKTFSHRSHLKTHIRVHTGDKPYSCSVCGRSFRQSSHIKNHKCGGSSFT